jgi:hypothetical protein
VKMPKGPRGEKRPADVIGNAVKVMRIATGQETEDLPKPDRINAGRRVGAPYSAVRAGGGCPSGRVRTA